MIVFVRDNLFMRSRNKNDASKVYEVIDNNRNYLRKWLPWVDGTDSIAVIENVITEWEKNFNEKGEIVLGIYERGEYIGNIGLHDIKKHNRSGMIGYWITEKQQGRGIITDCVRAIANLGFHMLDLNRIYLYCTTENEKSKAIPERLGFVQEGTLQDGECLYGVFYDFYVYGMVKRNWNYCGTLSLVIPTLEHKESALGYKQEHIDYNESHIHGSAGYIHAESYEKWFEKIIAVQSDAPPGFVTGTTYFAIVDGKIIGTISVRHYLNDSLMKTGGHIGFGVRPSERRKGYGVKMLSLALEKCRAIGIEKALVTCDKDNIGSAKTIIYNGGVLENEFTEEKGNTVQRYWITT
jgi:predicted acetyltransferase